MTKPIIEYYSNGNKRFELYCDQNDKLHHNPLEGQASISYYPNGEKCLEVYSIYSKLHNPYGPAWIEQVKNIYEWWFNGFQYTKEVNEYLDRNDLIWQNMSKQDFDIMWISIL